MIAFYLAYSNFCVFFEYRALKIRFPRTKLFFQSQMFPQFLLDIVFGLLCWSHFFRNLSDFDSFWQKNRTKEKFSAVFNLDKTALKRIPHYRRTAL